MSRIVMDRRWPPLVKWTLAATLAAGFFCAWMGLPPQAAKINPQARSAPPTLAEATIWQRTPRTLTPMQPADAASLNRGTWNMPGATPHRAVVTPQQLTVARLQAAEAFLNSVRVVPAPRGGFAVQAVLRDSAWDRMGLRPGDVIYTLDTPAMAAIDEASMVAMIQQAMLDLDVYRDGTLTHLQLQLNREDERDEYRSGQPHPDDAKSSS